MTAETVIWIPFIFLLSIAIADTFFVYMRHATATMALEDTTRLLVTGAIPDCDGFITQINAMLHPIIPSAAADCTIQGERANISLVLPAGEMGIGAIAGFIDNFTLSATNIKTLEYFEGT